VSGYQPRDPLALLGLAGVLAATLGVGWLLYQLPRVRLARPRAWVLTIAATLAAHFLCRDEPAGVRMLALIGALLYGMKAVVSVEARADGMPVLSAWRWLGFAALWPGMRPAPFAHAGCGRQPGAWALVGRGCLHAGVGL